jgi:hypothetical protein
MSLKDNNYLIKAFNLLKCIKCGYEHNIIPFAIRNILNLKKIKYRKSKLKYRVTTLSVPVCMRCGFEFQAWKRFKSNLIKSSLKSLIFIVCLLFVIPNIYDNVWEVTAIMGIFCGILIVYNINLYRKLRDMEYIPKKYMKFDKNGKFYVKPEYTSTWKEYINWLRDTIYEVEYLNKFNNGLSSNIRNMNFINCIYCGAKVKRKDIKCFKCGKLLPLI